MASVKTADILKVNLNGLELKNPILTASGTFGSADEYNDFLDVSSLGAVIVKAVTMKPRSGNTGVRIMETEAGLINSIGLENPGIDGFLKDKLPILKEKHIDFIMNIAGSTEAEYIELAQICETNKIKAIELNVSCPNVKSGCLEFGTDEKVLYELVSQVRKQYSGFLMVKLTPNTASIEKIGLAAQKAGADAVSAINTIKGSKIKLELCSSSRNNVQKNEKNSAGAHFKKTIITGGYSGIGIKPAAINAVLRLKKVLNIPIIGIGGIETLEDVLEFFAAGAEAVQIGTANFTHPDISRRLILELEEYIKNNGFADLDDLKKELRA